MFAFNCCAIPLHFHVILAINDAFIISRDELFSSLLISALPYVISHRITAVCTLAIVFKYEAQTALFKDPVRTAQ